MGLLSIVVAALGIPIGLLMTWAAATNCTDMQETLVPSATWSPASGPLSAGQIAAVQKRLTLMMPGQLNPAQLAALAAYLASPTQALFYPANDESMAWQTQSMSTVRNLRAEITTQRGTLVLPLSGGSSVRSATLAFSSSGLRKTLRPIPVTAALLQGATTALAVLLLCAGIAHLRGSPRGTTLHRAFAAGVIPLGVGTLALWVVMVRANSSSQIDTFIETLPILFGSAYGVAVLVLLRGADLATRRGAR